MRNKTENYIYVQTLKMFAYIVVAFVAIRFVGSIAIYALVPIVFFALALKKISIATLLFAVILIATEFNPNLISIDGSTVTGLRLSTFAISFLFFVFGISRKGTLRVQMSLMWVYLIIAIVSSMSGWAPIISFFKMLNFAVFFAGIWIGSQNLDKNDKELTNLRACFLAIAVLIIVGSVCLIPFPGISTLDGLQYNRYFGTHASVEDINDEIKVKIANDGMTLFCGIMAQSQALAPLAACLFAWVACDMIFVEKKFRLPHSIVIVFALPLIYKTRSRVGFLTTATAMTMIMFYMPKYVAMSRYFKQRLGRMISIAAGILAIVMVVAEIQSGAMTRWIRKTDELSSDKRSFTEAFTSSRQRLVDQNISYFLMNPFLGKGFQVNENSARYANGGGLVLSAPIEKGVTPLMILGETGIVGGIIFIVFLVVFYSQCAKKGLSVTATLFTTMLASNMGEASFFSPGGLGGQQWMICVFGGMVLDSVLLVQRRLETYSH